MPQKKTAKQVLDLVKHRGLSVLSEYEVSVLLRHHAEGAPFALAFKKRKVFPHAHFDTLENIWYGYYLR